MTKSKTIKWILGSIGLALILCGSVRLEKLDQRRAEMRATEFNARDYARDFWDSGLPTVLDRSVQAQSLIHLLNTDMKTAIGKGRTLGESRVHAYLLQGSGTIVGADKQGIALKLMDSDAEAAVRILTGLFIAGNAIRDASGLVDVSAFSDTMKFNKISSEINRIVVNEVIKPFLTVSPRPGQRIHFIGAAEVAEDATQESFFGHKDKEGHDHLLTIVPIRLTRD